MVARTTAVCLFDDREQAQEAVVELRGSGFNLDQIGVISRDDRGELANHSVDDPDAETGSTTGAVAGAATGAGAGALWGLGIAAGLLPAIGPVIAGGTLAAILASAATGAATAGLVGALVGLGFSDEEAEYYQSELTGERTLLTVKADGRYDSALEIMRRNGGREYQSRAGEPSRSAGRRGTSR
jgi:hypothetical protein